MLYLLPSTLGNDGSIHSVLPSNVISEARALRLFFVENAKSARAFLKLIEMPVAISELEILEIGHAPDSSVIEQCMQKLIAGHHAALISEAGAPAVADPGASLVAAAHMANITVRPLVGPSALLLALSASGLNGQCFAFQGYLPKEGSERTNAIRSLETESKKRGQTQMVIETPYRNDGLLKDFLTALRPETKLCLAINITQLDEQIVMQTVAQWRARVSTQAFVIGKRPTMFLWQA